MVTKPDALHPVIAQIVERVVPVFATVALEHRREIAERVVAGSAEIETALACLGIKPRLMAGQRRKIAEHIVAQVDARYPDPVPPDPVALDPHVLTLVVVLVESMRQSSSLSARAFRDGAMSQFYDECFHRTVAETGSQLEAARIAGAACRMARDLLLQHAFADERRDADCPTLH